MELIVTSSSFDQFNRNHIYDLKQREFITHPMEYEIVLEDNLPFDTEITLPPELGYAILDIAVMDCLRNCNYEKAATLLTLNHNTVRRFYNKYFPESLLHTCVLFKRICSCFRAIVLIHDEMLTVAPTPIDLFVGIEWHQFRNCGEYLAPWHCGDPYVIELEPPFVEQYRAVKAVETGVTYADTAWIAAYQHDDFKNSGVCRAMKLWMPCVPIVFMYRNNLVSPEKIVDSPYMKGFVELLKIPMGPRVGVMYASLVPDVFEIDIRYMFKLL